MNIKMKKLNEAQDLSVYKKLLTLFGEFVELQPGTGMGKIYRALLKRGYKVMPKDKRALDILTYVIKDKSVTGAVQDVMNKSFTDLPIHLRPCYDDNGKKIIAFWSVSGRVKSKIKDLLDLNGEAKSQHWSDEEGDKVSLIDLKTEE